MGNLAKETPVDYRGPFIIKKLKNCNTGNCRRQGSGRGGQERNQQQNSSSKCEIQDETKNRHKKLFADMEITMNLVIGIIKFVKEKLIIEQFVGFMDLFEIGIYSL